MLVLITVHSNAVKLVTDLMLFTCSFTHCFVTIEYHRYILDTDSSSYDSITIDYHNVILSTCACFLDFIQILLIAMMS